MASSPPNSRTNLDKAIQRLYGQRARFVEDYRRMQPWPPRVEALPGWDDIYRSRSAGLPVLPTIEEAVAWANALVAKIDAATP